jgi:iron complex outermembrane receptor protein
VGIGPRKTVRNGQLPGHVVTNLTVSTRLGQTDVSLGIYNVFNKRHVDPASFETREDSIRQNGRTYRVKLAYAF